MSVINDSITTIKQAIQLADRLKNVELRELLLKAKEEVLEAKSEVLALEEAKQSLQKQLQRSADYRLERGVYWLQDDKQLTQPFCPACFAKNLVVPMPADRKETHDTHYRCPSCKYVADPFDYNQRRVSTISAGDRYPLHFQ